MNWCVSAKSGWTSQNDKSLAIFLWHIFDKHTNLLNNQPSTFKCHWMYESNLEWITSCWPDPCPIPTSYLKGISNQTRLISTIMTTTAAKCLWIQSLCNQCLPVFVVKSQWVRILCFTFCTKVQLISGSKQSWTTIKSIRSICFRVTTRN